MAQTTNAITFTNVKAELSANGSAWTDVSGFTTAVEVDGGERMTEDTHTADGDTPIVSTGKREGVSITLQALYTEAGTDPYAMAKASYEGDALLYMRWSPKGGAGGTKRYQAVGKVTSLPYPAGEVGSAALIPVSVTIRAASITESTI